MPDSQNITAPLTIVGNGRSGTSLVSKLLHRHSQCTFVGETVNLIHSVWKSMESSLPQKKVTEIPEAIRRQFLFLFPTKTAHWMHKPIGVPIVWRFFPDEATFFDWFWEVNEQVFPEAKYFTVLRHPLDVVASSHRWWGRSYESIIESNRLVAKLVTHPRSQVRYAVNYHQMIEEPEAETRKLLDYLGLPFESRCLEAFEVRHVASIDAGATSAVRDQVPATSAATEQAKHRVPASTAWSSHASQWSEIPAELLTHAYREAVEQSWDHFGQSFGSWP